jgi:hypothetical protein
MLDVACSLPSLGISNQFSLVWIKLIAHLLATSLNGLKLKDVGLILDQVRQAFKKMFHGF